MDKFTTHTGVGVPLRRSNVDTDQIIPAVYLKRVTRTGFEDGLFAAWRNDPAFVLNQPPYAAARVLVAGPDFGTGSSREHAVWALKDYGFRAVISSRFADIFRGNSGKQGLLTAQADQGDVELLWKLLENEPGTEITVDLESRTVTCERPSWRPSRSTTTRWRLLEGLDDIGLTLRHVESRSVISRSHRPAFLPTHSTSRVRLSYLPNAATVFARPGDERFARLPGREPPARGPETTRRPAVAKHVATHGIVWSQVLDARALGGLRQVWSS